MTSTGEDAPDALADAMLAARLLAIDPGLGGLVLRGGDAARDLVIAALRDALGEGAPLRKVPVHVDDERLLGGLDLGATLASGRAVAQAGLLAEADGGLLLLPMAERVSDATAARIAVALDNGPRFVTVALDDGTELEERVPDALAERLAFRVDLASAPSSVVTLNSLQSPDAADALANDAPVAPDRTRMLKRVQHDEDVLHVLVTTAAALGIASIRAPSFALRAARAAAALVGRDQVEAEDVALAARLVLAPRATRVPAADEPSEDMPPPPPAETGEHTGKGEQEAPPLDDIVLAAALAALPPDLLARASDRVGRGPRLHARGTGERRKGTRGRPIGVRSGLPRGGLRLSLIDTLRAAAPWQRLRGRDSPRVRVRREDLRVRRYETRAETLTVFAVDASGSSALTRLAEAKGAVELLLAEAYVKRAEVALIAFRGSAAELLLPPTRSLTRARRALADLPGGGGTPLAAGLDSARQIAEAALAKGRTPFLVVLTDGRANIARDGTPDGAGADAEAAARAIATAGIGAVFLDISPRPRSEGAHLAAAMRARYLPLPRADAAQLHAAIGAAQP